MTRIGIETIVRVLRHWQQSLVGRGDLCKDTNMDRKHYCNGDQELFVADVESLIGIGTTAATP